MIQEESIIKASEVKERLSELFAALTPEQQQRIFSHLKIHRYKKNDLIYHEGEIPSKLLCLLSGKVKIYKEGVGGRSQIMRVLNAVAYFGYRASFSGDAYITAAAAFEPSIIVQIPLEIIQEMIMENTQLGWFFIRKLAKALGTSDERTVNLTQKHIRGRLAESILFLKDNYGVEDDGCTLCIHPTREDVANLSNMTTNNAIRTLSLFAHEQLIAIDGRRIKILNQEELEKISKFG